MSDKMTPLPFGDLLNWIRGEYHTAASIFGIPEERFFTKRTDRRIDLFGRPCAVPLGPAAGPHTQLAPNLIAAFLAGGRFMELKTVQKMDTLEIPKPCIDAEAEGYNTEWSTELTVEQALDEYLKAWVATCFLQAAAFPQETAPGFVYNLSVGYDLEGIKTPKIDGFIEGLKDASRVPSFVRCVEQLRESLRRGDFDALLVRRGADRARLEQLEIPAAVCGSVALSTMHGCPPADIEAICRYLLSEKKLDTFVKLNPTLLGHEFATKTLQDLGYGHIHLREHSFSHDLQYPDAIAMLRRLRTFAAEQGRRFGVKLSNTLAVVNDKGVLPGDEMYMSGRALYPFTITLAARLSAEFAGKLPISFSGGADQGNVREIFACGIHPITAATDFLKPGGYLRLGRLAEALESDPETAGWTTEKVDVPRLALLAEKAGVPADVAAPRPAKAGLKALPPLPLFDCATAPCVANCPIHQDVPTYARLIAAGDLSAARRVIEERNPLPHITGAICDHQCMAACTRNDYEAPVGIRDLKLAATLGGESPAEAPAQDRGVRVAVVGAGPSGLAAARFLARQGFDVTVFDQREEAGGTVRHVIPRFRITPEAIAGDVEAVRKLGVTFRREDPDNLTLEKLRAQRFPYVYLAVGAAKANPLRLEGDPAAVHNAVEFLVEFNRDLSGFRFGKAVAVVGGGNSAMDGARAALRVPGVEKVSIVYRRTEAQMPADREEFDNALADGVTFHELLAPVRLADGGLKCQKMALGEPGPDGRPVPAPLPGQFETIPADTVIAAVGEQVDTDFLVRFGLELDDRGRVKADPATLETSAAGVFIGGDAWRGPSTVVEAMADACTATDVILAREGVPPRPDVLPPTDSARVAAGAMLQKGCLLPPAPALVSTAAAQAEAARCLQCATVCDKCVEVCPNRANVALSMGGGDFANLHQILHVEDFCNECGNCAAFCPWGGRPYTDKFTLFNSLDDFKASRNPGFLLVGPAGAEQAWIRLNGEVFERPLSPAVPDHPVTPAPEPALRQALALIAHVQQNQPHLLLARD